MKNSIKYLNSFFAALFLQLLVFGALTIGLNAYGQDFVAASSEQSNILYRGYDNKLILGEVGCANQEYEIVPIDCKIKKVNSDGSDHSYIVRPIGRLKTATIKFVSKDGNPLHSVVFMVKNLPDPELYWGNNKAGSTLSSSPNIFIKYPPEVRLDTYFEIVSWESHHNDKNFIGQGHELSSEMLEYTRSVVSGKSISIVVKVIGPDRVTRLKAGAWIKR